MMDSINPFAVTAVARVENENSTESEDRCPLTIVNAIINAAWQEGEAHSIS